MEAINYESMKTNEPTRNFDSVDITNDYNVAAQNAQGLYGAFKFFHGIKSFFKGISALGTLATTSKIPVTDNDGNVTYTTPAAIKTALSLVDTTSLNGALTDYCYVKQIEVPANSKLILTPKNIAFAGLLSAQGTTGQAYYFGVFNGYGQVGTTSRYHIADINKGSSYNFTINGGTFEFYNNVNNIAYVRIYQKGDVFQSYNIEAITNI